MHLPSPSGIAPSLHLSPPWFLALPGHVKSLYESIFDLEPRLTVAGVVGGPGGGIFLEFFNIYKIKSL